jgi:hypothetical protein
MKSLRHTRGEPQQHLVAFAIRARTYPHNAAKHRTPVSTISTTVAHCVGCLSEDALTGSLSEGTASALPRAYRALVLQVALVPRERNHHVGVAPALELLDPRLSAVERVLVRYVVHHDGRRRAAVVHGRQRPVPVAATQVGWAGGLEKRARPKKGARPTGGGEGPLASSKHAKRARRHFSL